MDDQEDHEAHRRAQRERLEFYLIAVFKKSHRIDLANDAAAMRRIVELATQAQVDHEADPRLGLEVHLPSIAPNLDLRVTLTRDELVRVFSGNLSMPEGAIVREPPPSEKWQASLDDVERDARAADTRPTRGTEWKPLVWGLLGGICILSFSYAYYFKSHKEEHDEKKTEDRHARTSGTTTTPTATTAPTPDPSSTWVRVPSCTCIARGESIKNTFTLGAPTTHESVWYFDWTQYSTMLASHRTLTLGKAEAGASAVLPPAAGIDTLRLTLACDGDIAALVSGNIATAWAGNDDGQLIWTTKLPAALARANDAGAFAQSPMQAAFDVACTQVLTATQGLVKLDLANGKHVSLAMHDGTLH